ncbi:MAG: 3-methyl-2-oxobutanoate hydroxymethyltransferase [Planctomycetota bacterium]|jgi:3-methyl-2-oxobutanoate hydroxymethyltransferase
MMDRVTTRSLLAMRQAGEAITMCTAYGDSVANVVHGEETTIPVTLSEMVFHCRWVMRGRKRALVVGDMPFLSYQVGPRDAVIAAGRLMKEGRVDAVKLEGGFEVQETVSALTRAGIPVMGHVGLTPQSVHMLGGYRVQGRTAQRAQEIIEGAQALERAGAFAVVLECVPSAVAERVTEALTVPTIGIGAGSKVSGQVLVFHDLLGLTRGRAPRFVKRYADLGDRAVEALTRFREEVRGGVFPAAEHGYGIGVKELEKLTEEGEGQVPYGAAG